MPRSQPTTQPSTQPTPHAATHAAPRPGAQQAGAAEALARALADAQPEFESAAACRLDTAGPDVADVLGGRVGTLLAAPDRSDPQRWGRDLARALLARAPHLAQVSPAVLADVAGTLADVARRDWVDGRADRASLLGAAAEVTRTLRELRTDRPVPVDLISDLLAPGRSELADALDEAADAPFGLTVEVAVPGGRARVHRDPDRSGGLVVELFAGAGGWAEGLLQLGVHDVGLEWDENACRTRVKAGHSTIRTDVAGYSTAEFAGSQPWGLIASPPCQSYSNAGRRLGIDDLPALRDAVGEVLHGADPAGMVDRWADRRSGLVLEIVRWARDLRPDFVACEETPGAKPVFDEIAGALDRLGYRTVTFVVNAADFGVSQKRSRVILLAHRRKQPRRPAATHSEIGAEGTQPWVTMFDVVGFGLDHRPAYTLPARNAGGGPRYEGGSGARANIRAEQRSGHWRTRTAPDGTVHPDDARAARGEDGVNVYGRMTPAEAGMLQGFRRDYPWSGSVSQQVCQIGNAVPPPLARAVLADLVGAPAAVPVAA